jgi:predicted tellurium resistance membrane protein TerC
VKIIGVVKKICIIWTGHIVNIGGIINAYKSIDGTPKEKRIVGRLRCSSVWEDNNKMDLKK